MREFIWRQIAKFVSRPAVAERLVLRALETPYTHITSADGKDCYMARWWLFNPYGKDANGDPTPARSPWLPSVRIHHILRADQDRDLHDHPWNARTIVLKGWYDEELPGSVFRLRTVGMTGRILFGQYHRIHELSPGGVLTLFITWRKRGTWGFLVNGKKVPWREYLGSAK